MKTNIICRKTPHSVIETLFGIGVDMVEAWCFVDGDSDNPLVKRWIPKAQCYVSPNTQDKPDYDFTDGDMRKYSVDVWNAKCLNRRRFGAWKTNFELQEHFKQQQERLDAANAFMSAFS